ncbi:DUF6538 domain-containing protein [Aliirhizobium cellulosilyticum]|uniref:DUF6538 domain-containing protein n=1 Tax=Aliirhizobium cellulosilyticum TaxID=393664 RepID=UPI0037443E36
MAVRHDVENLTRRGNIFYWRARIPNTFQQCRSGSRLSLSLHCSDHKKAQVIGRKLNTLLAELKMNLKEPMSKAQLQKLCEHERDMMLEHLEDVSTAARRYGRPADIAELEMDIENGWAYRLIGMFGLRHRARAPRQCASSRRRASRAANGRARYALDDPPRPIARRGIPPDRLGPHGRSRRCRARTRGAHRDSTRLVSHRDAPAAARQGDQGVGRAVRRSCRAGYADLAGVRWARRSLCRRAACRHAIRRGDAGALEH